MSSKRDREPSSDELNESVRTSSIPRHLSTTSIADTSSSSSLDSSDVQLLRRVIERQRLELLHEQQLREQLEQEQHDLSRHLHREQLLREREQLIHEQQQREFVRLLHHWQQLRLQLEKRLRQLEEQIRLTPPNSKKIHSIHPRSE